MDSDSASSPGPEAHGVPEAAAPSAATLAGQSALVASGARPAGAVRQHQTPANFREWANLLSATPLTWRPGKTLNLRQPDVELLVLTLSDVPLTMDKFAEMGSGRDWVILNVCVLAVGPPGFSSVPYAAAKKSNAAKVEAKALYDVDEGGNTRFFPFEKGATNKDRGERVSLMTVLGSDDPVDATTVLEHGTCLSFFMRQENFAAGSAVLSADATPEGEAGDVLPAKSMLALVLGSCNVVQASKGYGLKLKKGKRVAPATMLPVFAGVPQSEEQADAVTVRSRAQPTICGMTGKDDVKVFGCVPAPQAFATTDADSELLVLCNATPSLPEVFFTSAQLEGLFGVERALALKMLNVAIATKALRVLVVRDDRPTSDEARRVLSVGSLAVDWNHMLHMHVINGLCEWPGPREAWGPPSPEAGEILTAVTADGTVLWTCPGLPLTTSGKRNMYWALRLQEARADPEEAFSAHWVTDGAGDAGGHALDLFIVPPHAVFDEVFAELDAGEADGKSGASTATLRHQMRLRLRPERKGASGSKKRRAIEWDE